MHQGLRRAPFALALAVSVAASFIGAALPAAAQDDTQMPSDAAPPAVARIAAIDGQVGVKHGEGGTESSAAANAPVMAGDYLTTGEDGRAEVQLDANTIVRAGANTQVRFTQLNGQADVTQIAQGQLELRVLQDDPDQVQVQTPSVDVEPAQPGAYLITVTEDGNTEVTARSGSLSVVTPQGTQQVDPGRTMLIGGNSGNPQYRYEDEVALSNVEQWGDQRDQTLLAAANQAPPGAPGGEQVAGMGDLDQDGNWVDIPGYGEAWVPNDVSSSWTPYSDGTWVSEPYYGYTWVAAEPWGWAPYHYGRWAYATPYGWAWVPGPIYARPAWSPALVAFFGFGGAGVGIGFNSVGWVPLAPGEYYRPWWGRGASVSFNVAFSSYRNYSHGFVGVPYGTWQHGVIHDVHPLSAGYLSATHFSGGTLTAQAPGFNTRPSYRPLGANFPQPSAQRFAAIHPYGTSSGYRVTTASAWQHFGTARSSFATAPGYGRGYAQPSYSRGYAQPSYSRGYAQPSYSRGYAQPSYSRGYAQPSYSRGYAQPSYSRGYAQPSYGRGYAQPSYNRGYQQPYSRGYQQSYGGAYRQPYSSGYYGRAASAPRQPSQSYSRGSAPSRSSSGGGHSHGPGRP